jgi:hypothetical protein
MTQTVQLSVEDAVRAVVHIKRHEDPLGMLSISEVCRDAGVSRANLYAHHRPLLKELFQDHQALRKEKKVTSVTPVEREEKPANLKRTNKALLYLCLELQMEIRSLRARLPVRSSKRS